MTTTRWMAALGVALALAVAVAGCKSEVVCPGGQTACGESCRALAVDAANCGACGHACAAGEVCSAGACSLCAATCTSARGCQGEVCLPDVEVACFTSDQVQGLAGDLQPAGAPVAVADGPISLAVLGGRTWVSHALSTPDLRGVPVLGGAAASLTLGGGDLEVIRAHAGSYGSTAGLLYVSNATSSSLVVVDPAGPAVRDEVNLQRDPSRAENPKGIAFVGDRAYVALYGDAAQASADWAHGQAIAVVDLPPGLCVAPPCAGVLARHLSLQGVAGAADAGALPYPSGAAAVGSRVFVALANLKLGGFGYFTDPAGPGKLLVVDTAAGDALSVVQLGACQNPGALAAAGTTVWVACGGAPFAATPVDSIVLPVDVSARTPVVGNPVPMPAFFVAGSVAICGGQGYVTDQFSGSVARFDPARVQATITADVCPVFPPPPDLGFAWASDVSCSP